MAGETSTMPGTLHRRFSFDLAFEHVAGVAGLAFLDLHSFRIGNLLAVLVFRVVACGAFQSFLMRGMGKFDRFFSIGVNRYLSWSLVDSGGGHADQADAAEKRQRYATHKCLFHVFLPYKNK